LALGSSNSYQPLSKVTTLAPKLAKPLGMALPPSFLDPVSPIRINHHFVLFIIVFCVNKVTQKLDFGVSTSLSSYLPLLLMAITNTKFSGYRMYGVCRFYKASIFCSNWKVMWNNCNIRPISGLVITHHVLRILTVSHY
jgi:hypothetical protein